METSTAIELAAQLCRRFEGFRAKPYRCPAGVPTIGYGSTHYADGRVVTMEDAAMDEPTANALLLHELQHNYLLGVLRASPVLLGHSRRLAAIVDFAYNLGLGRYRASTLRKRINSEDWAGASVQLKLWTRGGGKVLPGLVKRREVEAGML